ncbi:MAG TPA: hypothetical protein VHP37_22315 [Burkholderiales bacterium]|nr:hypothetical protein [Burkholderiales bacterium]
MKKLIVAALAAAGLGGCVAVPAPYYGDAGYYGAPAVSVGVYSPPVYYGGYRRHWHHRHW